MFEGEFNHAGEACVFETLPHFETNDDDHRRLRRGASPMDDLYEHLGAPDT
jgi:hypothetical protein